MAIIATQSMQNEASHADPIVLIDQLRRSSTDSDHAPRRLPLRGSQSSGSSSFHVALPSNNDDQQAHDLLVCDALSIELHRFEILEDAGMAMFDAMGGATASDRELLQLLQLPIKLGLRGLCCGILMQRQLANAMKLS